MVKPNFFVTAASVHGGFMKTDMDSYLSLIRRMIQQKCATTQDLIQSIRRNKIGESGHVTPNEFRFTLIKFGVILPQPLVDKIFMVFDSDRSGTMDFDEFAMWIMNSEFHGRDESGERRVKAQVNQAEEDRLRGKIQNCIRENQAVFQQMKKSMSFLEFISEVNRKSMPLTEKEARSVFLLFDPQDSGFMDTTKLKHWANTGVVQTPPPSQPINKASRVLPSLHQCIVKICGQNTVLLAQSFAHLPRGQGSLLPLEEFRRCLLSNGLGQNVFDTRDFYEVLCGDGEGKHRGADIDMLMDHLTLPVPRPEQEVSQKKAKPSFSYTSHAHRRLREALRKSYKVLKAEFEAVDKVGSGWLDAQVMFQLLLKYSMPMTFQDFRYITTQFKTEEGGGKVNWAQFLAAYLPTKAPHMLDGVRDSIPEVPVVEHSKGHGQQQQGSTGGGLLPMVTSPVKRPPAGEIVGVVGTDAISTVGGNGKSQVLGMSPSKLKLKLGSSQAAAAAAAAASSSGAKPAIKTISMRDQISSKDQDPHSEMRRIWQAVLRECHRSDPERSGCVSRIAFINALESANLNKTMAPHSMSRLADKYTTSHGLVDYLACFRTYLTAISQKPPPEPKATEGSGSHAHAHGHGHADVKCHHPWDFDYIRSKSAGPYWTSATAAPRDFSEVAERVQAFKAAIPSLAKRVSQLSVEEVSALKSQYTKKCCQAAKKVHSQVHPSGNWRQMKNEFRSLQVNSQKGNILTTTFYQLMQKYGVKLSISEMHSLVKELRGTGNQDVVRYEEFLRLCSVCDV